MVASPLQGRADTLALLGEALDRLPDSGAAFVIRGEAGIGKSVLLEAAAAEAMRRRLVVLRTAGVETEANLPYAGLHQLLRTLTSRVDDLPPPQRVAIQIAFGVVDGDPPPVQLVGMAALSLLGDRAEEAPLVVLADDVQWLDQPTAEALAFVARRIEADPIVLLATVRSGHASPFTQARLTEIDLRPLDAAAARRVLDHEAPRLSMAVRRQVLAVAEGNPLALVELSRFASTGANDGTSAQRLTLTARLERTFAARAAEVPGPTRRLLLVAALDPRGDLDEILAAARGLVASEGMQMGGTSTATLLQPAIDANLVRVEDDHLHFRHPLVRSAIEESSTAGERRAAHLAIASAITDIPDRRAWHRALSIAGEDDDIASELAAAGERALARGAAEPAFRALERAAAITSDPSRRSTRRIDAAELAYEIGQPDAVTRLLGAGGSASLSQRDRLRALRLREAVERPLGDDEAVARLVVGTDEALALGDIDLAFALLSPAALRCFWGHPGDRSARMVLDGVDRLGRPDDPRTLEILGLTAPIDSFAAVEVVARSADDRRLDSLGVLTIAFAAHAVGDFVCAFELLSTAVSALRREGRLALLAQALTVRAWDGINVGRFAESQRDADEGGRLAEEAELPVWVTGAAIARAFHAGIHGDDSTALAEAAKAEPILMAAGVRSLLAVNQLARGVAHLASGRSSDAVDALARMFDPADTAHHPLELFTGIGYIAEAAALADRVDEVRGLLAPVELTALRSGAPALHGGLRFARAVLAKDDSAEARFHEAIAGDLGWPFATARLRLAYGEWLRRHRRIADSRPHLRSAVEIFEQLNVLAWAERGRQELRASGERVADARRAAARNDLSPQELQIARMAADGLTNREIAERLFLSHRTVGSHLYRIFPKLGIASRSELAAALDDEAAVFA